MNPDLTLAQQPDRGPIFVKSRPVRTGDIDAMGESVAKGEPLLEVETDKAVMEIESPGEGVLAGVKVQPGTEVPVGRTIAWIVRPGEVPPADEIAATSGRKSTTAAPSSAGGVRVSPLSLSALNTPKAY